MSSAKERRLICVNTGATGGWLKQVNVAVGSFASVWPDHGDVRSTPGERTLSARHAYLKGAKLGSLRIGSRRGGGGQRYRSVALIVITDEPELD